MKCYFNFNAFRKHNPDHKNMKLIGPVEVTDKTCGKETCPENHQGRPIDFIIEGKGYWYESV